MIRIDFGPPRGAVRGRLMLALAVVLAFAAGAAGLRVLDHFVPLAGLLSPGAESPQAAAVVLPASVPSVPPSQAVGRLRRSDACRRVLALGEHLPAGVRFTTLAGRADGDFALQGATTEDGVPSLLVAVDSLAARSHDVGLSYWRSGAVDSDPRFQFHISGRVDDPGGLELAAVSAARARDLVGEVEGRAREAGLSQIVTEPTGAHRVDGITARRSHRLWASGSYAQIRSFAHALEDLESQARVEEFLVAFAAGAPPAGGQVSASYDLLVIESVEEESP